VSAVGSADAAEMAQVPRNALVMSPRANLGVVAADRWEQSAENAKDSTQGRKGAKQREKQLNRGVTMKYHHTQR